MRNKPPTAATVFVDADNTLWDTDGVYAAAQLGLLDGLETAVGVKTDAADRLQFIRAFDQEIAERHHAGLRYPPKLLAHAVALGLRGDLPANAVRRVLKDVDHGGALDDAAVDAAVTQFFSALKTLPPPRLGVAAGLKRLAAMGCLVIVVTEGAQARIASTAAALRLTPFIHRLIEAPKQTRLYQRVAKLSQAPAPMFMVGDQLQRDIAPAKAAGLETIYFPGNFAPKWEPAEAEVAPHHRIDDFRRVVDIVTERLETSHANRAAHAS